MWYKLPLLKLERLEKGVQEKQEYKQMMILQYKFEKFKVKVSLLNSHMLLVCQIGIE